MINKRRPYRIGLALSGGGARGFAHLGALYAMDELGIKPDIIAGVSAGSIAAALYGAGLKPLDIMKLFMVSRFGDFCEIGMPKDGLFKMNGFKNFLNANLPVKNLEQCPVPVVLCATDLDNCKPVQWRKGAIAERVMASCCIPILFKPVKVDGTNYVDGGVLHNVPSWAIRDECEHLIGINVSPLVKKGRCAPNLIDITMRSYHLMLRNNVGADLGMCDTVISTDAIAEMRVFDMKEKEKVFKIGYRAAREVLVDSGLAAPDTITERIHRQSVKLIQRLKNVIPD